MIDVLRIHPKDNVCVAVRPLPRNALLACSGVSFELSEAVPLGAKISLSNLATGDKVIKFGEPIGSLTSDAPVGTYIHTHNLASDYLKTYERGELVSEGGWSES